MLINRVADYSKLTPLKIAFMLQHGWKIALLYLIFLFFVHHGRKIVPALYIYPSTWTENNTRAFVSAAYS